MRFFSCLLHVIILHFWCLNLLLCSKSVYATAFSGNISDRFALLALKEQIKDPFGTLNSWNQSINFCEWYGVSCSKKHPGRVTVLNLQSRQLEGPLFPYIGNLSFLQTLILFDNSFYGELPQEIGHLFRLQTFNVRKNLFSGQIPTNLSLCSNLRHIVLAQNRLSGTVPTELTTLSKVEVLHLSANNFTGKILPSLGNLSALNQLRLTNNNLEGSIPDDLCRIPSLFYFQTGINNLTGNVPTCLYNLSSIFVLELSKNQLKGNIPPNLGLTLPNLQELYMALNQFTGSIPVSLTNASRLEIISFGHNHLIGSIPRNLGTLQHLRKLYLNYNHLGTTEGDDLNFITSLTNCTHVQDLNFLHNFLRGPLPDSIANLSTTITFLNVGSNRLHGHVPAGITNLVNLNILYFGENNMLGTIPTNIGQLYQLRGLYMHGNGFSGKIPTSLGNLTLLMDLVLGENRLHGNIPTSLANCRSLTNLNLSYNNLNGTIPKQVIGLSSLKVSLVLSHNALTGSLPLEVGNMTDLTILVLSANRLSGRIPDSLGNCLTLEHLYLDNNLFEGEIPQLLSTLKGVWSLDLSSNKLSGEIPEYLGNFTFLTYLNLSFNQLEGPVPNHGIFRNATIVSKMIVGNSNLCGGMAELKLPSCAINVKKKKKKKMRFISLKVTIPVTIATVCLIIATFFFLLKYPRKQLQKKASSASLYNHQYMRISYAELSRATNNFSIDNLLGVGSYGCVYKGNLHQVKTVVAIKVLNLQQQGASRSFLSECNVLRNLRHRNLIKIITACSSLDFLGNEFKSLVFEYMPKGNLEDWLHPKEDGKHEKRNLDLKHRLNIAIDIALALEYLHHHCQPPIVHCDLKPSNVLLDDEMIAHVADFGLSKILSPTSYKSAHGQASSLVIKGSIGYVAPEYGLGGEVSLQGDIYSYGILVLEMFTGKRPTNDMFVDGLSLRSYVHTALPEKVMEIVDPLLLRKESDVEVNIKNHGDKQGDQLQAFLVSVIGLGLTCSAELPIERTNMTGVVRELLRIRDHLEFLLAQLSDSR